MKEKDIVITGTRVRLTEHLKDTVHEKVEKLFRHEDRILRILVELGHDSNKSKDEEYFVKGHIEIKGSPMIVTEVSDDILTSLERVVDKLDRKIRRRSRLQKVKRKSIHGVDIPADLPKVGEA
jgi:putative sigma-54 modulation protein